MGTKRLHQFRLNARELLRQPGLDKHIVDTLPATELGVDDERIVDDVTVDLMAVSAIDGIGVAGTIALPWRSVCRRCLAEVAGTTVIEVDEMYQDPDDTVLDDDAFEIIGDQIDLVPVIREHLLLELPDDPLCRDDCAGICPVCGTDRNQGACECDTTVRDERWAALDELRLDGD
jgi:uncharacterized protein